MSDLSRLLAMTSATSARAMTLLAAVTLIVGSACGGDSSGGGTTFPGGGQGSSKNSIKLGDTLARSFAAGARSDTLTLAADRVLRFHVDVQQTGAGTSGVLDFAVIDPTTGASVTSGTAVPASSFLGTDPFSSPGLFHWYCLPHSGSFNVVVTIRAGVTYSGG